MGPQHPSTHGVLRLILELDAETVTEARAGIGYLHTGIEEHGVPHLGAGRDLLHPDGLPDPMFQEAAYCLAVEKALGITDQIPERASIIRVLMMELTRISSHLVCIGTGGMEMGATTVMTVGFRERERILRLRTGHRPAHEHGLHPPRWRVPGSPARRPRPHHDDRRGTPSRHPRLEMLLAENPFSRAAPRVSGTSTSPAVSR